MIIASIIEPKKATVGDFWYSLSNRLLHEATNLISTGNWMWIIVPRGTFSSPLPPTSNHPLFGSVGLPPIWIDSADVNRIPHKYDTSTLQWIPVVPVGYVFPPINPNAGNIWTDSLTGYDFGFNGTSWTMLTPTFVSAPGGITVCPHCFSTNLTGYVRCASCFALAPGAAPAVPIGGGSNGQSGINAGQILGQNITTGGIGHLTFNPSTFQPVLTVSPQSALKIHNLVEIFTDGTIVYAPGYTPDKAAEGLWEAIAHFSPNYKENEKIKILESSNDYLQQIIQMYKDAGFELPGPTKAPDPNAAWNAAMGVII